MKKNKRWTLLAVIMLIVGLTIVGCASDKKASTTDAGNNSSNNAGTNSPTQFAKEPEFSWKMQVIHSVGQSDFKQNQEAAELVYKASNGRMKIEVVPNGTFANSMEAFQAAGEGVFEMHSSWPMYAKGIEYALLPLTTGSMSMDAQDVWVWMNEGGGKELMQKALDKLNLKLLATEIWGTEVLMSKKPFKSLEEMKGSKMRTSDPRMLATYGVAGIPMPLEEVFTAMATGAVESAEFGYLKYNEDLGLGDVSDYAIYPDFWNVHNVTTVVVNKDAWNKLPEDLKLIVQMAFQSMEQQHWIKGQYDSAVSMQKLKESGKMEFIRMDSKNFIEARKRMYEIEQEDIKKYGGLTKEVYESIYNFEKVWFPYKETAAWWGAGLTAEQQMGFDPGK